MEYVGLILAVRPLGMLRTHCQKNVANYLRPLTIFKNLVAANYQIPS